MAQQFIEGALALDFEDNAVIVPWDKHAAYQAVQRLPSKAVDFCVLHTLGVAVLECTDYRGFPIELRNARKGSSALALEVATKVRDTIAGMVWNAGRGMSDVDRWTKGCTAIEQKLEVVLWLEEDPPADPAIAAALGSAIRGQLKPWLNARVVVTSTLLEEKAKRPLSWVLVSRVPQGP